MSGSLPKPLPYLRYSIPSEAQIIAQKKSELLSKFLLYWTKHTAVVAGELPAIAIHAHPGGSVFTAPLTTQSAAAMGAVRHELGSIDQKAPPTESRDVKNEVAILAGQKKVGQTTQDMVTVTPNGTVSMGNGCNVKFEATAQSGQYGQYGYFDLVFCPSPTALLSSCQGASFLNPNEYDASFPTNSTIEFEINKDFYPYYVSGGLNYFRVVWHEPIVDVNGSFSYIAYPSMPIELLFSDPPCMSVHHVNFIVGGESVGASCTLVGSQNGVDPTFQIYLEATTVVDQLVRVSSTNTYLGWIVTPGHPKYIYFTIPAGHNFGGISWFLGTRNKNGNFDLVAELVDSNLNPTSTKAYGNVSLTKS
jgi:hypothetical protein